MGPRYLQTASYSSLTSAQLGCAYSRKFDHVSGRHTELEWLPVDTLIHYRTLCIMHQLYHKTFKFTGFTYTVWSSTYLYSYSTRCPPTFASIERCHLSQTQTFFAIREQSVVTFLNPLLLHVTFHPLFIIIYCSLCCSYIGCITLL